VAGDSGMSGIGEVAAALREGRTTSVALTERSLHLAGTVGARLAAFVAVRPSEDALRAARQADAELAEGIDRGPLHGLPVAIKDVIATDGMPTSACSRVPKPDGFDGSADAACVQRLTGSGAVVVGKTSTMEFAKGLPDPQGPFAIPRNPWNLDHWPGGSSCGSAAAVAAGIVPVALGTDTGGSTRMPAAYCGVTGLKPSYGLVSLDGCLSLAPSMDHIGILVRSAEDCGTVLDVLRDVGLGAPTTSTQPPLRIAVPTDLVDGAAGLDEDTRDSFWEAVAGLRASGNTVEELPVGAEREAAAAVRVVASYENYGVFAQALADHGPLFGPSARDRLGAGRSIGAAEHADASEVLRRVADVYEELFARVDVIALPTTPGPAETLEDLYQKPRDRLVFTRLWSAFGFPAVSVPMRPHRSGLPQGLQLIGRRGGDQTVLAAARHYQSVTAWHLGSPPLAGNWASGLHPTTPTAISQA
jgi:aspartyl-tRNA(Asn)/glutamyl-tRNA(Gln) amidotransferase subunit A